MRIDILSDLHINTYFNTDFDDNSIKLIYDPIFKKNNSNDKSDTLIIAGDLGHKNDQVIEFLKILKNRYYKYIICVLGNHDYYLVEEEDLKQYDSDSFKRTTELIDAINSLEDIYCLDGDIIEIEGIRFGGAMGWYDNSYAKEYFKDSSDDISINTLWEKFSLDYKHIARIKSYDDLYKQEYPKLLRTHQECDVFITHVNPSYKHEHINYVYHNNLTNCFFTFDGSTLAKNGSMKYWVFGHVHDAIEYELHGVKCICNPLGYPHESQYGQITKLKTIVL